MKYLILALHFFPSLLWGGVICDDLKGPNDILKCILVNSPTVKVAQLKISEAKLSIAEASQRPNPEFEYEGLQSKGAGVVSTVTLHHVFELGGIRAARMAEALSVSELVGERFLDKKEQLAIATVVGLYRLRQIEHELEVVNEIILTFKKITNQYAAAGRLSPEEKMSVSVFAMTLEENKLKQVGLLNERDRLLLRLELDLAQRLPISKKLLPEIKRNWGRIVPANITGASLRVDKAAVVLARQSFNLEKSKSWPRLSLGPKLEFGGAENSEVEVGLSMNLSLPIYQTNQAGIDRAEIVVLNSELQLKSKQVGLKRRQIYLHKMYRRISEAIRATLSNKQVNLKHENIHKLIDRGVVSAPIVIELHRQIMDYFELFHEQELLGVQTLWEIYALEGRVFTEVLK